MRRFGKSLRQKQVTLVSTLPSLAGENARHAEILTVTTKITETTIVILECLTFIG